MNAATDAERASQPRCQRSDAELLGAIGGRADRSAFAELFARYSPRLFPYFYRRTRNRAEADDLVQDVMLRVWASARSFDPALSKPSTWLFRIARIKHIDLLRRPPLDEASGLDLDSVLASPEENTGARQLRETLFHAIDQLRPEHAEVLRANYFGEESSAQISLRLGIPVGTVKSRVAAALLRLRRHLVAEHGRCPSSTALDWQTT